MDASCRHGHFKTLLDTMQKYVNLGVLPTAGPELTAQTEQCEDLHAKHL